MAGIWTMVQMPVFFYLYHDLCTPQSIVLWLNFLTLQLNHLNQYQIIKTV